MMENDYYEQLDEVHDPRLSQLDLRPRHQRYDGQRLNGRLSGFIRALQPLHVSTGLLVMPSDRGLTHASPLIKSFQTRNGDAVIPGASIKGAVRSLFEAVTDSCQCVSGNRCDYNPRRGRRAVCAACDLFGSMSVESKVYIDDALLVDGSRNVLSIPKQTSDPKAETRGWRIYPHAKQNREPGTWPVEIVKRGGRFVFAAQFRNVTAAQLGALLLVLGQGPDPVCIKLGGGKNSGLGAVRFEGTEAGTPLVVDAADVATLYTQYDSQAAYTSVDVTDCIRQALETQFINGTTWRAAQSALPCHFFGEDHHGDE